MKKVFAMLLCLVMVLSLAAVGGTAMAKGPVKIGVLVSDVSGEEALKCVKTKKYQLILLDHMMPHMDGIETLNKMREDHLLYNETKVVALTANAINGAREEYLASGFDDYLSKPIEVKALEDILKKWLPGARQRPL